MSRDPRRPPWDRRSLTTFGIVAVGAPPQPVALAGRALGGGGCAELRGREARLFPGAARSGSFGPGGSLWGVGGVPLGTPRPNHNPVCAKIPPPSPPIDRVGLAAHQATFFDPIDN